MVFKPMLAGKVDLAKQKYPCFVSPKLDGIRVLGVNGKAMTRKMKEVPNRYIQSVFASGTFDGLDGEIIVGPATAEDVYRVTNSAVMSRDGEPDFTYWLFDKWCGDGVGYVDRVGLSAKPGCGYWGPRINAWPHPAKVVTTYLAESESDLLSMEAYFLQMGYEGVMIRDPHGYYKNGRSTTNEGTLLKLKRFMDAEYEVVGFEERMHNGNEAIKDELGHTKRSSHAENKVGRGDLGALVLRHGSVTFNCGSGFTDAEREDVWKNRDVYLGKFAKIKSFQIGVKDLPRFPTFVGWRALEDM